VDERLKLLRLQLGVLALRLGAPQDLLQAGALRGKRGAEAAGLRLPVPPPVCLPLHAALTLVAVKLEMFARISLS